MTTTVVTIGNSDDGLTQREWAAFQADVDRALRRVAAEVFGRFHSLPHEPWQTAAWSFQTPAPGQTRCLRYELTALAKKYRQDSIAWTEGPTTFLKPARSDA